MSESTSNRKTNHDWEKSYLTLTLTAVVTLSAPDLRAQSSVVAQPLTSRSATASTYIERGNAWSAKGEYKRALADYDLAIASDPTFANGYYNRAITWRQLKDYERALADLDRVIQLNPRF